MANGKYLPADNPIRTHRDTQIINMAIQGMTTTEIGEKVDLDHSQVSRIIRARMKDGEFKLLLQEQHKAQIIMLPEASKVIRDIMLTGKKEMVRLSAAIQIQKNTGITPAHTQTTYINQLYMDNRSVLSPGMVQLLGSPSQDQVVEDDIIEMDTEE